jgi:SagB-type dehydrogenase family enzyme
MKHKNLPMKKSTILVTAALWLTTGLLPISVQAQDLAPIQLNAPSKTRGCDIMQALQQRQSNRALESTPVNLQDLSDLLWAANGINRPEIGKKTAPSAMNSQDVDIYILNEDGCYRYDALGNTLQPIAKGDQRSLVEGNRPSGAPLILVLTADMSKYRNYKAGDDTNNKHLYEMGALDAGIVSQNISLFCAAAGLGTVPRAGMNKEALKEALKLSPSQVLWLNHPIGKVK